MTTRIRRSAAALAVALSWSGLSCSGGQNQAGLAPTMPTPLIGSATAGVTARDAHGVPLTGTVSNSAGERVAGAIVTILDGENANLSVGTNASGEYRFPFLVPSNGNVSVTHTFYAEGRGGVYIDGANTLNFTLSRKTLSLSGVVERSTGERLSGATVTFLDGPNKDKTATSGADGSYLFSSVEAGNANLSAAATGYHTAYAGVAVDGLNALNFKLTATEVAASVSVTTRIVAGGGGLVPQEWEFTAVVSGNPVPTITEYRWNFGDGSSSTRPVANDNHVYGQKGIFRVTLVAVKSDGGTLSTEADVRVD